MSHTKTRMMRVESHGESRVRSLLAVVVLALVTTTMACTGGPAAQRRTSDAPGSEGAALYPTLAEKPIPSSEPYVLQVGDEPPIPELRAADEGADRRTPDRGDARVKAHEDRLGVVRRLGVGLEHASRVLARIGLVVDPRCGGAGARADRRHHHECEQ